MIYRLNGKRSTGHEYTMKKKELEDLGIDYDESDTQVQGNVIQMDITFSTKEKVGNLLNEYGKEKFITKKASDHQLLLNEISKTYHEKNTKYGNSFGDTFDKVGIISAYTRLSDKFNRFEYMVMNKDNGTDDERMRDTLLDMANYCLMTVMELEKENE